MKAQISQAQGLTETATKATGSNLANLQSQAAYGDLQKAVQQQQLDTQYADLMRKQDFPMEQVGQMSNILRGVPIVQTGGQTTTVTPPPSFASQFTGGLQALYGLSQLGDRRQ
jgi:beta-N-acetylglucosaminidase